MSDTITIDGQARVYNASELPRYASRVAAPGNGVGACSVPASTNLTETGVTSHVLKSISPAGTGQRASHTVRDIVPVENSDPREVTVVINVYYDGTTESDIDRAGYMLNGAVTALTTSDCAELKAMAQLGQVEV